MPAAPPQSLLHRLLFRFEPERAHGLALKALGLAQRSRWPLRAMRRRFLIEDRRLGQSLCGLEFPNPVGLAAGFDKDAVVTRALATLGFGFLEVGTVTPRPQPGNPRPRLFRYPREESLQNALGFNNHGLDAARRRLARRPSGLPLGVNLGPNRTTPAAEVPDDYARLFAGLTGRCDYFVVNVSSPNTPGLRNFQSPQALAELLTIGRQLSREPILVKLSPDLPAERAVELAAAAVQAGAAGVVLTNTSTEAALLPGARPQGGLSGRVLRARSFALLRAVAATIFGRCLLVSVGGVDSAEEAYRRLLAGASLVQLYTALVFHGPGLVARINRGLLACLERDGFASVGEAVGAALPGVRPQPPKETQA